MPFPLAHPAAVLPFRRSCPRFLNFPALIIGSLAPDTAYAFDWWDLSTRSHQVVGSLLFCLPVGLLCLWVFYRLRLPLVRALPQAHGQAFLPLCECPPGSFIGLVASLVIGILTHLFWDSFTHKDGWLVQHIDILYTPVGSIAHHTFRVSHILWYLSTFIGVLWLALAYLKWFAQVTRSPRFVSAKARLAYALFLAGLCIPLAAAHHLGHCQLETYAVSVGMILLVAGFLWGLSKRVPTSPH